MTHTDIAAFNAGIRAVLAIAEKAATRIAQKDRRSLHAGFAVEALAKLAQAGRALLIAEMPHTVASESPERNLNAS